MWLRKFPSQDVLSTKYDNSILLSIYEEFIPEKIVKHLDKCEGFDDFSRIRWELTSMVDKIFREHLEEYTDNVKKAFELWKFNWFKWTKEEEKQLESLLYQKNLLFDNLMLSYIEDWWLDDLLTWKDKEDIMMLLRSNINKFFNDLFLIWRKTYKPTPEEESKMDTKLYGAFIWGLDSSKTYWELSKKELKLPSLYNKNIEEYLNWIKRLSWETTSYSSWVENQNYENVIWWDQESSLWVVWPQEAYTLWKKVIEPHLSFYLKNEFTEEKEQASSLAIKYFQNDYNVQDVKSFFVEPLLEIWAMGFWKIAWESIPCDTELAENFKININTPSRFKSRTEQGFSKLTEFIWYEANIENIVEESKKFVVFHELGHSMFLENTKDNRTIFEELKADLFYFLKLLDEWEKDIFETRVIVEQIIIDAIRTFSWIESHKIELWKYEMEQYIIANAIELQTAFETWLISWRWNTLKINPERGDVFLVKLLKIFTNVKDLYESWYKIDTDREKKTEENLLAKYFEVSKEWDKTYIWFDENIKKFISLLK